VLAKDLLVDIFQRLINDKRIAVVLACRRVSKRWRVIAESDELWSGICDNIIPLVKPEPGQSWFAFYADVALSASVIQKIGHPIEQDQTRYINALCERSLITSNALWHFYQPTLLFDWATNAHGESILFLLAKQQLEKDLRKLSLHLRLHDAPLPFILAPKPRTRAYIHLIKQRMYHFIWYMQEEIQPRSLLNFLEQIAADKIPRDLCNLLGFWLDLMRDLFPKCEQVDITNAIMIETTKFIDGAFKAYEKTGRTQFQGPVFYLSKGIAKVADEMKSKNRYPDFEVLQYRKIFTELFRAARHQTVLHDQYEVAVEGSHHEEELIQIQQCLQAPAFQFKLYLESQKQHKPEVFQRFFQRTHQPVPKAISLTVKLLNSWETSTQELMTTLSWLIAKLQLFEIYLHLYQQKRAELAPNIPLPLFYPHQNTFTEISNTIQQTIKNTMGSINNQCEKILSVLNAQPQRPSSRQNPFLQEKQQVEKLVALLHQIQAVHGKLSMSYKGISQCLKKSATMRHLIHKEQQTKVGKNNPFSVYELYLLKNADKNNNVLHQHLEAIKFFNATHAHVKAVRTHQHNFWKWMSGVFGEKQQTNFTMLHTEGKEPCKEPPEDLLCRLVENERTIMKEIAKKDGSFKRAQHDSAIPLPDLPTVEQIMASHAEGLFRMDVDMNYLMLPQALRSKIVQLKKTLSGLQPPNPPSKSSQQPSKPISNDNAALSVVDARLQRRTVANLPFQLKTKQQTISKHVPTNIYDIYGVKSTCNDNNKGKYLYLKQDANATEVDSKVAGRASLDSQRLKDTLRVIEGQLEELRKENVEALRTLLSKNAEWIERQYDIYGKELLQQESKQEHPGQDMEEWAPEDEEGEAEGEWTGANTGE